MSTGDKATGFPSPAQGYEAKSIDFNQVIVSNPAATFIMVASTANMAWRGIFPGSLLVVDRSQKTGPGSVVVAAHAGEFICREIVNGEDGLCLTDGIKTLTEKDGDIDIFGTIKAVVTFL